MAFLVVAAVVGLAACSAAADSKECVTSGEAEVCAERDGGGLEYTASGLQPGTVVTFAGPASEPSDVPVSTSGSFDAKVGLLVASGRFAGTVNVEAIAADGTPLTGDLTFE